MPAWLYLLPVLAINVCASLLLKIGAADPRAALLLGALSWRSFLGLACFGIGGIGYAFVLRYVPLTIAQAVLSAQYVFTILGAWLLLHESINHLQVIGFFLVGIGIALVLYR